MVGDLVIDVPPDSQLELPCGCSKDLRKSHPCLTPPLLNVILSSNVDAIGRSRSVARSLGVQVIHGEGVRAIDAEGDG